MTSFIEMFFDFMHDILDRLNWYRFDLFGYPVSIIEIIVVFLFFYFVCAVLWRGVRV